MPLNFLHSEITIEWHLI